MKNQDFFQQEYLLGQVTYTVYSDDDVEWIYEKGGDKGTTVRYQEFIKKPWRKFVNQIETETTNVPSSTFTLPLTLCKWVKASQLGSIAKTGLNFQFSYVVFNGMSAGTPYLSRDLFLKGVWLVTGDDTGAQFMVDKEAYILLEVDVNRLFRDCYCRESNAVLWDKDVSYKKDAEKEGTVVCFADIPPQFIFCTVPEDIALAITEKFNSSKLKPGRQKLPALGRDLNDVIKALTEKAQKEAK